MTNSDGVSQSQEVAPEVVHRLWVSLIGPAYEALSEGRIQLGLSDVDIINLSLQFLIGMIKMTATADLLVREHDSGETQQVFVMSRTGTQIVPPAA